MALLDNLHVVEGDIKENLTHLKRAIQQCLELIKEGHFEQADKILSNISFYCGRIKEMEIKEEVISLEVEKQIEEHINNAIKLAERK